MRRSRLCSGRTVAPFTDLAPTTTNSVTSSDLVGGSWTNRDTIVAGALQVSGTYLRRPTGISSDRLTLFFYDEVASIERAIWRTTATGTFTQAEDVGPLLYAQPNAACTRLYYWRRARRPSIYFTRRPSELAPRAHGQAAAGISVLAGLLGLLDDLDALEADLAVQIEHLGQASVPPS